MRSAAWALLAFALAGCASQPVPPEPQPDAARPSAPPAPAVGPEPGPPLPPLSGGLSELHWALAGPADAFALELAFDAGPGNDCTVAHAVAAAAEGPAPHRLAVLEQAAGPSWSVGSGPAAQGVHAGALDTRQSPDGGHTAVAQRTSGPFSGEVRLLVLGRGLQPWDNGLLGDGLAAAASVSCAQPFLLLSARLGADALLLGPAGLSGGAGADAGAASANVADAAQADLAGTAARAACGGFGVHAAAVALRHPGGGAAWTFAPDPGVAPAQALRYVETQPGPHAFSVTRAGGVLDALWCAAWGLDDALALEGGRRAESGLVG